MEKARFAVAAILIMTACCIPDTGADPYVSDAGSIWIPESSLEFLDDSGHVLRYRFVAINSELLRASLIGSANDVGVGGPANIELTMFDDVTLIVQVVSYRGSLFKILASFSSSNCESDLDRDGSNGGLEFSK